MLRLALHRRTLPTAPTQLSRANFKTRDLYIQCNPAFTVSLCYGSTEG